MMWNSLQISSLLGCSLPENWVATGVCHDTRTLKPEEIYIALKGSHFDGHEFVPQAIQAGASAALVDHEIRNVDPAFPQIIVEDVLKALELLATDARKRSQAKIVGLTGSVGKTSSKEALRTVLEQQAETYVSKGSFNNHWGVPLTLANLPEECQVAVLEMGMNNAGEIEHLTSLAQPDVAYITNIEDAHVGKLGSIEAIAHAKAEIFKGLKPGGVAVINTSSNYPELLEGEAKRCGASEVLTFGLSSSSHVFLRESVPSQTGQLIKASVFGRDLTFETPLKGTHWAINFLGVLAVVRALGLDVEQAAHDLKSFQALAGRGKSHTVNLREGFSLQIYDESYNAGPASMKAALNVLGQTQPQGRGRRIAVLGDMLELGSYSKEAHEGLRLIIDNNKIDLVYTSGEIMQYLADILPTPLKAGHHNDPEVLAQQIKEHVQPGDVYMIKGSKGRYHTHGRMYVVVEALLSLEDGRKREHAV